MINASVIGRESSGILMLKNRRIVAWLKLFCLSIMLFTGCATMPVTPVSEPRAPLPDPGCILVYEHALTPSEIRPHQG